MVKFLLWCILLILCWPMALVALVLYPIVWLLLLPFRVVGIAVGGALELVWAIVTLPARCSARAGLDGPASGNHLDQQDGDGDDQEDMDKPAHRVRGHQA